MCDTVSDFCEIVSISNVKVHVVVVDGPEDATVTSEMGVSLFAV